AIGAIGGVSPRVMMFGNTVASAGLVHTEGLVRWRGDITCTTTAVYDSTGGGAPEWDGFGTLSTPFNSGGIIARVGYFEQYGIIYTPGIIGALAAITMLAGSTATVFVQGRVISSGRVLQLQAAGGSVELRGDMTGAGNICIDQNAGRL